MFPSPRSSVLARLLPEGSFRRNVAVVAFGTGLAQGAIVLAAPVLTRLYEPEDFGVLAVFVAIVTMLSLISSWSFQFAIPLPEDDRTGANVLALSTAVLVLMTGVVAAGTAIAGPQLIEPLNTPGLEPALWLVPVGVFVAGLYQSLNYWAIRIGAFTPLATSKAAQGGATVVPQIGAGLAGGGAGALVGGDVVGRAAAALLLAARTITRATLRTMSLAGMRQAFVRYRRFPLFSSWGQLLNTLGAQLPPVVFAGLYGSEAVGWFGLSFRVLAVPTTLVGGSVAQVFVGEAARLAREDVADLDRLYLATARRLFAFGLVPYGLVAVLGAPAFRLVFGGSWEQAGVYAQIMAVMLLVTLVVNPLSLTLSVLERQDWQAAWDALRLVVVIGGMLLAGAISDSPTVGVMVYAATSTATLCVLWLIMRAALRRSVSTRTGRPEKLTEDG